MDRRAIAPRRSCSHSMLKKLALRLSNWLSAFAAPKKPLRPKREIVLVFGCSATIDREKDTVTILHHPGDSFEKALERHQHILAYLRREGYL